MLKLGMFASHIENFADIKNYLRYYANRNNIIIKEKVYYEIGILIQEAHIDACLIDFKTYRENKDALCDWQVSTGTKFIFATSDIKDIIEIIENHPAEYCILTPIEEESFIKILDNLKAKIKERAIVIKLAHNGEKRLDINHLNYINITNRNLRYHLTDNTELNSQTLRQSFQKEIAPLLVNPELYFIAPSLLINLINISELYADHINFTNGTNLFFPRTAYEKLREAWKNSLA